MGRAPALALWVDPTVHAAEVARFRSKIVAGPRDRDCTIWIGSIGADGYGLFISCAGMGLCVRPNRYALALAQRQVRAMASDGLRVIAVAHRELTAGQAAAGRNDPDAFAALCGEGLRFAGLLGLSDTPRPDAAGVLEGLADRGIGIRLITGDHPVTATAIAAELGMAVTADRVISGPDWEGLSRRGQEQAVRDRMVFARMSPEHKVQVVETLERVGQVCAMVGDGANDAAAIRVATVGIGVAARGSDPARTAADMILLDGRIASLLDALDEGRQLWRRVQAAVSVLLGGNAGEVAVAIIGTALTGRSPLNTRQLLLVNMLTDALPAAALAVSRPHSDLRYAGRGPDRAALWRTVATRGTVTAGAATGAWVLGSVSGRPRRASTVAGRAGRHAAGSDSDRFAQPPRSQHRCRVIARARRNYQHARAEPVARQHAVGPGGLGAGTGNGGRGHRSRRDSAAADVAWRSQ